jgi:hypothetical protein
MTAPNDPPDPILTHLPPERLLETSNWHLIQAGLVCMHHVETVQRYVAYENQHDQRPWVLQLLAERATDLRNCAPK